MGEQNMALILLTGGGPIGYMLWLMSVVVLALSVQYFINIRRATICPPEVKDQIQALFDARKYREAIELTETDPSFLSYTIHAALTEAAHGYNSMSRAMEEAADERTAKLFRHIEMLNLLGNIGPMLGLMGTVQGMIGAFFAIVEKKGSPNPADLARDIGVALVTTLLGLGVAIPALAVFSFMRNRIAALAGETVKSAQEMISGFRPSPRKASAEKPE